MLSEMLNFTYKLQDAQGPRSGNRKHGSVQGDGETFSNSNNKSRTSGSQVSESDLKGSLTFRIPSAVTKMVKNKKVGIDLSIILSFYSSPFTFLFIIFVVFFGCCGCHHRRS